MDQVIKGLLDLNPDLNYFDISSPFEAIVNDKFYALNIDKSSYQVSKQAYIDLQEITHLNSGDGLHINYRFDSCGLCYRYFDKSKQQRVAPSNEFSSLKIELGNIFIYACGHHFH